MLRSSCLAWMLPMKHICYLSYNRSGCSSWISFITVVIQAHASSAGCQSRFSFSFLPKRGQNEIVWVIGGGGKYVFMCKACGKLRASGWGACPGEMVILNLSIWWNLGLQEHIPPPYSRQSTQYRPDLMLTCALSLDTKDVWIRVLRFWHTVLVRMGDMNIHILGYLTQELWRMRAYPPLHV